MFLLCFFIFMLDVSSLRIVLPAKSEICRYYRIPGGCVRGEACFFAHGDEKIRKRSRNLSPNMLYSPSPLMRLMELNVRTLLNLNTVFRKAKCDQSFSNNVVNLLVQFDFSCILQQMSPEDLKKKVCVGGLPPSVDSGELCNSSMMYYKVNA